jgi:uncharacterized protein (DUF849 family)
MPVDRDFFDYYIKTVKLLFGEDTAWCGASIGAYPITLNERSVSSGGHDARTGLEDNVRPDRDRLAPSNAALVECVVDLCENDERPVATWQKARAILGLSKGANTDA